MKEKKKVFVGMSGGVDSSVSAALLVRAGYDVTGVFIRVWEPEGFPCTWRADRRDAMRVAAQLDIPLLTLDLEKEYKQGVVDYMLREYAAGRTPNPDVMCNKEVKFGAFYKWAMERGADYVATGHYAQIKTKPERRFGREFPSPTVSRQSLLSGEVSLFRSRDENKDQTYFLWTLKPEQLSHILFPIGGYNKSEVRDLAKKFKLWTAEKHDSQGLCFIGKLDTKLFLKQFIKSEPGQVLDEEGKVVGEHDGAVFYTIGERHGFVVRSSASDSEPLYVVDRNLEKNQLIVAPKPKLISQARGEVSLEQVNWITSPDSLLRTPDYHARIRHRGELYPCEVKLGNNAVSIKFKAPPVAIASGQSLVLYDGELCLGGGVIA